MTRDRIAASPMYHCTMLPLLSALGRAHRSRYSKVVGTICVENASFISSPDGLVSLVSRICGTAALYFRTGHVKGLANFRAQHGAGAVCLGLASGSQTLAAGPDATVGVVPDASSVMWQSQDIQQSSSFASFAACSTVY